MLARPDVWEEYAISQDTGDIDPEDEAFMKYYAVWPGDKGKFKTFLMKLIATRNITVNALKSGQYQTEFSSMDHIIIVLDNLYRILVDEIKKCLTKGRGSQRRSFIEAVAKHLFNITGAGKAAGDKWAFLVMHALQNVEEVTNYPLGVPTAKDQICGEGSALCMKWIRYTHRVRYNVTMETNADVLQFLQDSFLKKARECVDYRTLMAIFVEDDGTIVWDKNGRPVGIPDMEKKLCEGGKRPITKTLPSRTTDNPKGATSFGYPIFPKRSLALSKPDYQRILHRVRYFMDMDPQKKELPVEVFRLPTEDLEKYPDAFASDNEEEVQKRPEYIIRQKRLKDEEDRLQQKSRIKKAATKRKRNPRLLLTRRIGTRTKHPPLLVEFPRPKRRKKMEPLFKSYHEDATSQESDYANDSDGSLCLPH
jgi:hypothetical protein